MAVAASACLMALAACLGVNGNGDEDTAGAAAAAGVAAARRADSSAAAIRRSVTSGTPAAAVDSASKGRSGSDTGHRG